MILTHAEISSVRNLQLVQLDLAPQFNLITGNNGAGKTSILEALHLLSTGYSFRTRKTRELIHHGAEQLTVIGRLKNTITETEHRAGLQKTSSGETFLKLDFEPLHSMAEMTRLLPIKALFPDSHRLIQDGPAGRRQFLDWGLFHVEHDFFGQWKNYRRALDQRNQSLRKQLPDREVNAWNTELVEAGTHITERREDYVQDLQAWLKHYVDTFGIADDVTVHYKRGWTAELTLADALKKSLLQCQRFRTTTVGPHRGELVVEFNGLPAKQVMSRGQQKLLVYALHFAQLSMFTSDRQQEAVVLCDDLPAELDSHHLNSVLLSLQSMNLQTFVTSNSAIEFPDNARVKVFHVEHGAAQEVV